MRKEYIGYIKYEGKWVVKIAKHVGAFKRKLQIKYDLENDAVEIENSNNGASLIVPRKYFDQYQSCPENIIEKLAENIDEDRVLKIGTFNQKEVEEIVINEKANTLGFQYKDYILTIEPASNNVTEYKGQILSDETGHIFSKTKINGTVSRIAKRGEYLKKPRIIFNSLVPIQVDKEKTLFDKDNE